MAFVTTPQLLAPKQVDNYQARLQILNLIPRQHYHRENGTLQVNFAKTVINYLRAIYYRNEFEYTHPHATVADKLAALALLNQQVYQAALKNCEDIIRLITVNKAVELCKVHLIERRPQPTMPKAPITTPLPEEISRAYERARHAVQGDYPRAANAAEYILQLVTICKPNLREQFISGAMPSILAMLYQLFSEERQEQLNYLESRRENMILMQQDINLYEVELEIIDFYLSTRNDPRAKSTKNINPSLVRHMQTWSIKNYKFPTLNMPPIPDKVDMLAMHIVYILPKQYHFKYNRDLFGRQLIYTCQQSIIAFLTAKQKPAVYAAYQTSFHASIQAAAKVCAEIKFYLEQEIKQRHHHQYKLNALEYYRNIIRQLALGTIPRNTEIKQWKNTPVPPLQKCPPIPSLKVQYIGEVPKLKTIRKNWFDILNIFRDISPERAKQLESIEKKELIKNPWHMLFLLYSYVMQEVYSYRAIIQQSQLNIHSLNMESCLLDSYLSIYSRLIQTTFTKVQRPPKLVDAELFDSQLPFFSFHSESSRMKTDDNESSDMALTEKEEKWLGLIP